MKKKIKVVAIIVSVFATLAIIASATKMLQSYTSPSNANYPTLKNGNRFFTSILVKPERFSFIAYSATTPEYGQHKRVHRICGIEGDKVEIINGDLFVNNKSVDKELSLAHMYVFPISELVKIEEEVTLDEFTTQYLASDSMMAILPVQTVEKLNLKVRRFIIPADEKNEPIYNLYAKPWNQDNFGPIIIPKDKFFLLGDNRSFSEDSRYIGLIDKSDYVATVLGK